MSGDAPLAPRPGMRLRGRTASLMVWDSAGQVIVTAAAIAGVPPAVILVTDEHEADELGRLLRQDAEKV
jgi:hypothetical protein